MPLTPEEETQLEFLLRKKYCHDPVSAEPDSAQPAKDIASMPAAQIGHGPAKKHGDIIDIEPED